ncbi:Squalene epoxidase [Rhizophlyctis rosea]|nr:Squalene epoxidase [Rhizophlyctis rosea]
MYQIGTHETRILIDIPGKLPSASNGDLQNYLTSHVCPQLPKQVQPSLLKAIETQRPRSMPNSFLAPTLNRTPGVILAGDALNMRHPLTGGGMTVALWDVVHLRGLLGKGGSIPKSLSNGVGMTNGNGHVKAVTELGDLGLGEVGELVREDERVQDLADDKAVQKAMRTLHWKRKNLSSAINILAMALYELFAAGDSNRKNAPRSQPPKAPVSQISKPPGQKIPPTAKDSTIVVKTSRREKSLSRTPDVVPMDQGQRKSADVEEPQVPAEVASCRQWRDAAREARDLVTAAFWAERVYSMTHSMTGHHTDGYVLACVYYDQALFARAERILVAIDADHTTNSYTILRGQCLMNMKDDERAFGVLQEMIEGGQKNNKTKAQLLAMVGLLHYRANRDQEALKCSFQALESDPTCFAAVDILTKCQWFTGKDELEALQKIDFGALGDVADMVTALYRARVRKYDQVSSLPNDLTMLEDKFHLQNDAYILRNRAELLYMQAEFRKSIAITEKKATNIDAHFTLAHLMIGRTWADEETALRFYSMANLKDKGSHLPLLYMGIHYLRADALSHAELFLSRAKELCEVDPLVSSELGTVYYKQEEFQKALSEWELALKLASNTDLPLMQWESLLCNLGNVLRELGRLDEAKAHFEKVLEANHTCWQAHAGLAYIVHLNRDLPLALHHYHEALRYNPDDSFSEQMLEILQQEFGGNVENLVPSILDLSEFRGGGAKKDGGDNATGNPNEIREERGENEWQDRTTIRGEDLRNMFGRSQLGGASPAGGMYTPSFGNTSGESSWHNSNPRFGGRPGGNLMGRLMDVTPLRGETGGSSGHPTPALPQGSPFAALSPIAPRRDMLGNFDTPSGSTSFGSLHSQHPASSTPRRGSYEVSDVSMDISDDSARMSDMESFEDQ